MVQSRGFNINTQNLEQEYDYIIVGQGLAGSCLALALIEKGKSVMVFNDPNGKSSSRVAGGLINPITRRNMVLTWRANLLFPFLKKFYKSAERKLDVNFYYETPIYRPLLVLRNRTNGKGKAWKPNLNLM